MPQTSHHRRKRKPENEHFYELEVEDWDAHVSFNEYLYINIFNAGPYEEHYYITLKGKLSFTTAARRERVMPGKVVLHPSDCWKIVNAGDREKPIGDMITFREPIKGIKKSCLVARVSIPTRSYELIRSYLTYKVGGRVRFIGAQLSRGQGEIFYLGFDSAPRRET